MLRKLREATVLVAALCAASALSGVLVGVAFVAGAGIAQDWGTDKAAAWVQAIGAVLAIVAVGAISIYEATSRTRERKEDEALRERERELEAQRVRLLTYQELLAMTHELNIHLEKMKGGMKDRALPGGTWKVDQILFQDLLQRFGAMAGRAPDLTLQILIVDSRRLIASVLRVVVAWASADSCPECDWTDWLEEARRIDLQTSLKMKS